MGIKDVSKFSWCYESKCAKICNTWNGREGILRLMILIHIANMFSSTILSIITAGEDTHLSPHKLDVIIILKSLVIQWLKKIILIFIFVLVRVILFYIYSVGHIYFFFFGRALWDLSSLTRDWTPAPSSQSTGSWPLDHQEIPFRWSYFNKCDHKPTKRKIVAIFI